MGENISGDVRAWEESGVNIIFSAEDTWGPPSISPDQFGFQPGIRDEVNPGNWDQPTLVRPGRQRRGIDNIVTDVPLFPDIERGYTIRAINVEHEIALYTQSPAGEARNNTVIGQALCMYDVYTQDPWNEPSLTEPEKLQKLFDNHGRNAKKEGRSPVMLVAMDGTKLLGVGTASKIPEGLGYSHVLNPSHPHNLYPFERQMRAAEQRYGLNNIVYVENLYVTDHRGGNVAIDLIRALAIYARSVGGHDVLMRTVRRKPGSNSMNPRLAAIAQAIGFQEIVHLGEYVYNHNVLYGIWRGTVSEVEDLLVTIRIRGARALLRDVLRNERGEIH